MRSFADKPLQTSASLRYASKIPSKVTIKVTALTLAYLQYVSCYQVKEEKVTHQTNYTQSFHGLNCDGTRCEP